MALPILVVAVVIGWPIGRAIWASMHVDSGTDGQSPTFIGVDNYTGVLGSSRWWQAVGVLAAWTAIVVIVQILVGVLLAATMHQLTAIAPVLRVIVVAPFAVFSVAAASGAIAAVDGGFLAQWAGIDSPAGPWRTLIAVGLAEVWRGSGLVAVIILAGFARVPRGLTRWLRAEGATALQRAGRVVLPALAPALAFAAVFRLLDTWRGFGAVWARMIHQGHADMPQALVYSVTFDRFDYGLAGAMVAVFLIVTLILGGVAGAGLHWARTGNVSGGHA